MMESSSSWLSTTIDTTDLANKPSSISKVFNTRDLFFQILSRAPAESLLRFKSVCKHWESSIKHADFVRLHHTHHKKTNQSIGFALITAADTGNKYNVTVLNSLGDESESESLSAGKEKQETKEFDDGNLKKHQAEEFVLTLPSHGFAAMMTSCNGLLCFHTQHPMLIWNPVTKECVPFGKRKIEGLDATMCGLGFDARVNKYKLVKVYESKSDLSLVCEVLELGTTMSWRRIQQRAKFPHPKLEDEEFGPESVFVEGSVHWLVKSGVLCFDVTAERFELIPSPNQETRCRGLHGSSVNFIGELAGSLCWNKHYMDAGVLAIWEMQKDLLDQKKNPWVSRYLIDVSCFGALVQSKAFCSSNRKLYLKYGDGVACYDTETKEMVAPFFSKEFDKEDYYDCVSFTRSIVCLRQIVGSSVPGANRMASTGKSITLELETAASVGSVKARIQEKGDLV